MIPAIVLSSHTAGLGVIRALGSKGVPIVSVYYEKKDMGYVSRYVKERVFAPHPERHEEDFVGLLIEYARKNGRGLIVPADDATLSVVSRHKSELEEHHLVACPDWSITGRIIDKKHTYALAEKIGVMVPRTLVPNSFEEMAKYGREIEYPCLVKPCESHRYYEVFKRKMVRVENLDELISAYRQAACQGIQVMLQEYIPGEDDRGVNYNSYFLDGEPLIEFTAAKVRLSPQGFGVPSVVVSKEIPEILAEGRKILKALGYSGFSCTEFKKDSRDGVYKFMEVNGRHNRSAILAVKCGINYPWIEYQHLVAGKTPVTSAYRHGIYWVDEFRDFYRYVEHCRKGRFTLISQIRPYLKKNVFAVFDPRDSKPFFKHCLDLLKSLLPGSKEKPSVKDAVTQANAELTLNDNRS